MGLRWCVLSFFSTTLIDRVCFWQGVFPAFFALYVSMERRSSIQAMQFSNGLTNPAGLWLGHLMFDGLFCVLLSTVIVIIFAATTTQFNGLGYVVSHLSVKFRELRIESHCGSGS